MDREVRGSCSCQEDKGRQEEMNAQTQSISNYLQGLANAVDRIKSEVETLTAGLSDEQMRWSPDNKRWSIGQVIDHLNKVAEPLLPKLDETIENARKQGLIGSPPFKYRFLERL